MTGNGFYIPPMLMTGGAKMAQRCTHMMSMISMMSSLPLGFGGAGDLSGDLHDFAGWIIFCERDNPIVRCMDDNFLGVLP